MAIIAMGILLINYFQDSTGNLGIIIIAIGGFFFLIGMKNKKTELTKIAKKVIFKR